MRGIYYFIPIPDSGGAEATVLLKGIGDRRAYVYFLQVPRQARGRGYGRMLIGEVLRDADANGVTLLVEPGSEGPMTQQELVSWYERLGFERIRDGRELTGRVAYERKPKEKEA